MNEEQIKQFKTLSELAKTKFAEIEERMIKGEDIETMKSDLEKANELAGQVNDLTKNLAKQQESQTAEKAEMQKQFDEMSLLLKEHQEKGGNVISVKEFWETELPKSAAFKEFKEHRRSTNLDMDEKTLYNMFVKTTMTTALNYSGNVVPVDRGVQQVQAAPHEPVRIRSLVRQGTTASNTVDYVRQTANTAAAATVVEGASKAESNETLTVQEVSVKTIAHLFRITRQALNDYSQMTSYLSSEGVAGLKDVEDTQILSGSGLTSNMSGIITEATTAYSGYVSGDQQIDVLRKGIYLLKALKYFPTHIVVDTASMQVIKGLKDGNNNYIYPSWLPNGPQPIMVDGVPVIEHTAIAADTFLIGDFSKAYLWDREQVNVRFSEEDGDNFTKNLITVRIEERAALAVTRPDAFISNTFTLALSTLT